MIRYLLRKKRFLLGATFLTVLLLLSFGNTVFNDGKIKQVLYTKDSDGNVIHARPHAPMEVFWLGSDPYGYSLAQQMIEGAKYTIGAVLVIVFLRIVISLIASYIVYTLKPNVYKVLKRIFEPFTVIPQTFIAYFILFNVLMMDLESEAFPFPFWHRVGFQVFILVMISIPNLTVQMSGEMRALQREDYFMASKTLGGSKWHQFFRHTVPNLYDKWILLFGHQFLQVLLVLAHLGFFNLFFGGTINKMMDPPRSLTNEWSGIIGNSVSYFYANQWMALVPFAFYVLTAISVALMNDAVRSAFLHRDVKRKKAEEGTDKKHSKEAVQAPFEWVEVQKREVG